MYNCSSSVNDLAPAPKHILKLTPKQSTRILHQAYTQAFVFQQMKTIYRYIKLAITGDV